MINEKIYERHKLYYNKIKEKFYFIQNVPIVSMALIICAPLHVLSIQKQLSIDPHINLYNNFKKIKEINNNQSLILKLTKSIKSIFQLANDSLNISNTTKSISKKISNYNVKEIEENMTNKKQNITLRNKINNNLIKLSGMPSGQQPYKAPIYESYFQIFKSYNIQGVLSFWKGTLYRISFIILTSYNFEIKFIIFSLNNFKLRDSYLSKLTIETLSIIFLEIIFHPLYLIECRYILQNRLPNFRTYENLGNLLSRSYLELYKGCLGHIPKTLLLSIGINLSEGILNSYNLKTNRTNLFSYLLGFTLSYPITTAIRRIACQNNKLPGLLPIRYLRLDHALLLIKKEEGVFKGLFKGFIPYIIAQILVIKYFINNPKIIKIFPWKNFNSLENDEYYSFLNK